jgi:hypothetical protein
MKTVFTALYSKTLKVVSSLKINKRAYTKCGN